MMQTAQKGVCVGGGGGGVEDGNVWKYMVKFEFLYMESLTEGGHTPSFDPLETDMAVVMATRGGGGGGSRRAILIGFV